MNNIKKIIQKLHIKWVMKKYTVKTQFKEAFTILKYVKKTGSWPHGDEEYQKILEHN